MYEAIEDVHKNHVVTHENDRAWRNAVIMNQPSMLALRYQRTEESYVYPYKLIRLTSKFIKFRVVKVCVLALYQCVRTHNYSGLTKNCLLSSSLNKQTFSCCVFDTAHGLSGWIDSHLLTFATAYS